MPRRRTSKDPIDDMLDIVDDSLLKVEAIEKKVAQAAPMDALRATQDDLRGFVEAQNKEQTKRVMETVDARHGLLRSGVMADTEKLLREHLSEWMEEKLKPMVEALIEEREKRAKVERDMLVQRWKNRFALGTAALLFIVAMYQTIRPKPDNARDYTRPIERLNDLTGN